MGTDERSPDGETPAVGRRRFVQQLAGDAVGAAGRLAGMGQVVHSSMVAAGRAFSEGMESVGEAGATVAERAPAGRPRTVTPPAKDAVPAPASPPPIPELTPAIRQILERAETAVMAVNQPGAAPQLSVSRVSFDGEVLRIASRAMTARVANLQRDPRVTLAIVDERSGDAVVVTGRAELVYGDEAQPGLAALSVPGEGDPATAGVVAPGDIPVLIVVRPERVIRRTAELPRQG